MVQRWAREPQQALSIDEHSNDPRPRTADATDNRSSLSTKFSYPASSAASVRSRRSSLSSHPSVAPPPFDINLEIPQLIQTPWELDRSKKNSLWRRAKSATSLRPPTFKKLPREVYDCIMEQLELLHLARDKHCPACLLQDLYNISLTSRAWDRAATVQMYSKVWLLTNEEHSKMPKLKIKGTGRLKLLRRTLRERHGLARYVRELHLPDFQRLYQTASIEREQIVDLVASLVYACPNLERIVGFHIPYAYSFDRLSQALSTRRNLKERVWVLSDDNINELDDDEEDSMTFYHAANDPTERFLELNSNHPALTTLILHQDQLRPELSPTFRAIIGSCRQLTRLRHLSISGLAADSFSNLALNALPPYLHSLRLENLPGITDKGLIRFSASPIRISLRGLSLINLEISNLTILSNFLSHNCENLQRFTFSQYRSLYLPPHIDIPFLQSKTLSYIHWEIRSQAGPLPQTLSSLPSRDPVPQFPFTNSEPICCLATSLLAASIKNNLFPSLRIIRVPHDPQGRLQDICRPLATALLPSDMDKVINMPGRPLMNDVPSRHSHKFSDLSFKSKDRTDSPMSSPMTTEFPLKKSSISSSASTVTSSASSSSNTRAITPIHSRLAAQARILAARRQPLINVQVTDPSGTTRVNKPIYGFMGKLDSTITYNLRPDRSRTPLEHSDDGDIVNEWLTDVGDLVGDWEVIDDRLLSCGHVAHAGKDLVYSRDLF